MTYWIKYHIETCPVCGKEDRWQERIYKKPKPKDFRKRYVFTERFDWCEY